MCDSLIIDGKEYDSIRIDGACLCNSTTAEIFAFIAEKTNPQIGDKITITRTAYDWEVKIERSGAGNLLTKS